MSYKFIEDLEIKGKKVLARFELNVKYKDGKVKDPTRIIAAVPTSKKILEEGGKLIIMAHLGRPQEELGAGKPFEEVKARNSLDIARQDFEKRLGIKIKMAPDSIGPEVEKMANELNNGEALMLENLRLYAEEQDNDNGFAEKLASLGDIYINDAFGAAHRQNASITSVPLIMLGQGKQVGAGYLMQKELETWSKVLEEGNPRYLIVGGAKLKEKIKAVKKLSNVFDSVYVGGLVQNVLRAALGKPIGDSLVAEKDGVDYVSKAKEFIDKLDNMRMPESLVIAKQEGETFKDIRRMPYAEDVPEKYSVFDVIYEDLADLTKARSVVVFGPLGMFEKEEFSEGCRLISESLKRSDANIVFGGGETADAYDVEGATISTGGGASITLLATGTLAAKEALEGNKDFFRK